MNSYIFKKEIWVSILFTFLSLLILILVLPMSADLPKRDFVMILDYGDGTEKKFTSNFEGNISAWDTLQQANANSLIQLDAAPDFYPKNIDSLESGQSGKNWVLYVNGSMVSESPINVNVKEGDRVLWRFE